MSDIARPGITYTGIRNQQKANAKPFYMISVKAEELLSWADVPRKAERNLIGFQRGLDKRFKKITEFYRFDPGNVIPGAIIVALRPGVAQITATETEEVYRISIGGSLESDENSSLQNAFNYLYERLSDQEKLFADSNQSDSSEVSDDEEEDSASEPTQSYMASMAKNLRQVIDGSEELSRELLDGLEDLARSILKPGVILDGQHRVFGAAAANEDIFLPVVLMPNLPPEEQVLHFYTLNNKAKQIKPTHMRSMISSSLSLKELENLSARLIQSGVKVDESQWTTRINSEETSPFFGLVDFGLSDEYKPIPENPLHNVARAFLKPEPAKFGSLVRNIDSWKNDSQYDYRLQCFYEFWRAVKDEYPSAWQASLEGVYSRIHDSAMMKVLQLYILDQLVTLQNFQEAAGSPSMFSSPELLYQAVKTTLRYIPEEFFTREWQEKSLDDGGGREFLFNQLALIVSKRGERIGDLTLFRKK